MLTVPTSKGIFFGEKAKIMKAEESYHHGDLLRELIALGLSALEREGAENMSLRSLAEAAGVSKTAPYRHFRDKEDFLGALANEGFRLLHQTLSESLSSVTGQEGIHSSPGVSALGRGYMKFAVRNPALYRLMNSPLICRLEPEKITWARQAMMLLGSTLAKSRGGSPESSPEPDSAAAAWGYIHGLVLLRIDGLFPPWLEEPDWERLAGMVPGEIT
jgi:AcrR family transcriptional regulator